MIHDGQVAYYEGLIDQMVDIDSVTQHPENYNMGDVDAIKESILSGGMYRAVIVQESTRHILAGNHTWEACKALDAKAIPVTFLDCGDEEARKIMVKDNRLAALAMPDPALLSALLGQITSDGEDVTALIGTGYSAYDLEVINHLADIPLEHDEFGQWPTFTVQLPPHVLKGFREFTREADTDRDKFEVLLRLAGWSG